MVSSPMTFLQGAPNCNTMEPSTGEDVTSALETLLSKKKATQNGPCCQDKPT